MTASLETRPGLLAHQQLQLAEMALLAEVSRGHSLERWAPLATAHEIRARAWLRLAATPGIEDRFGYMSRALKLAAQSDEDRAALLRRRLAAHR